VSSLSDQLKSLGVKLGMQEIQAPRSREIYSISDVVPGKYIEVGSSSVYVIEAEYPHQYHHGKFKLAIESSLVPIVQWARLSNNPEIHPNTCVFLDTETSGLAGGTGTFAFLVGVGHHDQYGFHLKQFFMPDPLEEPALLLSLEEYLSPYQSIVTFNGKSFDIPLLNTRYTLQGWQTPFGNLAHIDLLHLARRLWRNRLPSRTLSNLEYQILGATRTEDEVPGWMIPELYFEYLRSQDARPMKRVLYHNAMDVLTMSALLNYISSMLNQPLMEGSIENMDRAAIARIYEEIGQEERAIQIYQRSIDNGLPTNIYLTSLSHLAAIHKRRGEYEIAIKLWEVAAQNKEISACIELAKYYEHRTQEFPRAIYWADFALNMLNSPDLSPIEVAEWKSEIAHRLDRLTRKSPHRS
jgi:hypothetical protein